MTENRRRYVGPDVERRYLALARDGALHCPACGRPTRLTPNGRVSLRVFDEFRGHLMLGHDVIEFVEVAQAARASTREARRGAGA